jgi:formylglycine-generating enzyme required for sulfatase activity
VSSITQAKAEAQKLIKRYNKLQAEAKTADTAEAARKASEAEKLVSQISALQSAIAKLQAKDRESAPYKSTVPSKASTTVAVDNTSEEIRRTEAEKTALEERIGRIEEAQKKTRAQIEQLTRAKAELARLKQEAEKSAAYVAQERRANDERLQQELAKLIKKKEAEHLSLKQELEAVRQQALKDAELLKIQRDAARAMIEKQKQLEQEQSSILRNRKSSKGLLIGVVFIAVAALLVGFFTAYTLTRPNETNNIPAPPAEPAPPPADKSATSNPPTEEPEPVTVVKAIGMYRDPLKNGQGPLMVKLPGGTFKMGSKNSLPYYDERPQFKVTLNSFSISKYEITFAEYDQFASDTGQILPDDKGWGRGNQPVINVSWDEASEYTKWLTQQTGHQYRLPSEREWEYAAAAGTETTYWWGYEVGKNRANCGICGSQWDNKQPSPVGSFQPNAFGINDTIGNVLEWTNSCFHPNYREAPAAGQTWEGGDCSKRVVRSSSFRSYENTLRTTKRNKYSPTTRMDMLGFRVVRVD